ncbi:MAG: RDD family protein [Vicinamibacterales bacterium]
MSITRLHAVLACVLLFGLVPGASLSAQTPASPPVRAGQADQPPAPVERVEIDEDQRAEEARFRRPIIRIAQNYTLSADDVVREVRSVFSDVVIEGRVDHDVVVVMGSARLAPTAVIGGSLVVVGGSATIDAGASIRHDLALFGGTVTAPATFSPGGQHIVIGSPWLAETLDDLVPWITRGLLWGRLIVPDMAWIWGIVAVFFLLYLALNTVFDRPVGASADALVTRPLSVFMVGLLVLLLTGPFTAIVAASVIGLFVVPFILCAVIVMGLVGKTAVARAIGRSVLRPELPEGRIQATAAFVIGFGLLTLAYMVPVLGFVTWALTTVFGMGAATVTFRALLRRERPAPTPAPAPAPASVAAVATPAASALVEAPASYEETPLAGPPPIPPPPAASRFSQGLAQYPRATFLDRLAAFALDCVLVAIANAVLDMSRNDGFFFFLLLVYHIAFWAWRGTTLGGIIVNLRVIRTHGAELRPADAVVRGLSSVFSLAALGIGCFWMLQDPESQMWHDKIAGTLVVKVPRDLVLP